MHIFLGNYKMIQINNKQKQQRNKSDTHKTWDPREDGSNTRKRQM